MSEIVRLRIERNPSESKSSKMSQEMKRKHEA